MVEQAKTIAGLKEKIFRDPRVIIAGESEISVPNVIDHHYLYTSLSNPPYSLKGLIAAQNDLTNLGLQIRSMPSENSDYVFFGILLFREDNGGKLFVRVYPNRVIAEEIFSYINNRRNFKSLITEGSILKSELVKRL